MYIREQNSVMGKGFTVEQLVNGKMCKFMVNDNKFDSETVYEYRAITKCVAGFLTISEGKGELSQIATRWEKNRLHTLEVKNQYGNYQTVLAMKGGKFYMVDKSIVESLTVGDIHSTFPKMADHNHWKSIGSKTWADPAYGVLVDSFKNVTLQMA
tara:strand:+ start:1552 stop:2016 length:465 start_codon:yes stop_codon:yes gene_type:complete